MKSGSGRQTDGLWAAALFLLLLGLYAATAAPDILFEDTGEFVIASRVLGVSHPPGYPLYLLLGQLFSRLPVREMAFGVVMFSCAAGAAGCCALFFVCRLLGCSRPSSWAAAAALGVSRMLWSQCAIPEVYALGLLLGAAQLYVTVRAYRERSLHLLAAAVLLLGLNFLNHYIVFAAYAPVTIWLGLTFAFRGRMRAGAAAAVVLALLAVVSFAFYLPLRAAAAPALVWGDKPPVTPGALLLHLRRSEFVFWENQLAFHLPTKWKYLVYFFEGLPAQFSFGFVLPGLIGLFMMLVDRFRAFAFFAFLFAVQTLGVILFINFHFSMHQISVFSVFFISAYMIFAVFIAYGLDGLRRWLSESGGARAAGAFAAAVVLLPAWPLALNLPHNLWLREDRPLAFGRAVFRSMERDAVFLLQGAIHSPPAGYLYVADNLRRDVVLIDGHGALERGQYARLGKKYKFMDVPETLHAIAGENMGRAPVYTANKIGAELRKYQVRLLGPVYRIGHGIGGCDMAALRGPDADFRSSGATQDFNTRFLEALVDSRRAECLFIRGRDEDAIRVLGLIEKRFQGSPLLAVHIAGVLEQYGKTSIAEQYYLTALRYCPTFTEAYRSLGDIELRRGNVDKAKKYYQQTLRYTPNNYVTLLNLGNLYQTQHDYDRSVEMYQKVLKLKPDAALAYKQLGIAYEGMQRWNEAERAYKKAIAVSPDLALAYNDLGALYTYRGDYVHAVINLEKFTSMEPDLAAGWFNLALAELKMDDYTNAATHFREAMRREPESDEAVESLKRLTGLYLGLRQESRALDMLADVSREFKKSGRRLSEFADMIQKQIIAQRQSGAEQTE